MFSTKIIFNIKYGKLKTVFYESNSNHLICIILKTFPAKISFEKFNRLFSMIIFNLDYFFFTIQFSVQIQHTCRNDVLSFFTELFKIN